MIKFLVFFGSLLIVFLFGVFAGSFNAISKTVNDDEVFMKILKLKIDYIEKQIKEKEQELKNE